MNTDAEARGAKASIGRPVYILGAGFSKAINRAMPITRQLGREIRQSLPTSFDLRGLDDEDFEDWLTLRVSGLPFLDGYANTMRRAEAERVIAEIAKILDERVELAAGDASPLWLSQLVLLWHAQRAVVLTFNYDTLLEQAINSVRPTVTRNALSHGIYADEVVFPAPPAPASQYMMDGAGQADDSFQVLKLHGSLNWYWAAGDSTGSTLVRLREKRVLGGAPLTVDVDFAGASTLDRYLIPPVTSKDSYYNSYLSHTLWRSARNAIEAAPRVTLMGYSMPSNDRVAVELVRQANTDLTVVDLAPGSIDEPLSLVHRLSRIGRVGGVFAGESALIEFTSNQLEDALTGLRDKLGAEMPERDADAVVLATSGPEGQVDFHCLWIDMSGLVRTYSIDPLLARGSDMPLHAIARNQIPASQGSEIREFLSRGSLRSWLSQNRTLKIQSPIGEVLAIDASEMVMERWRMVRLSAVWCA